MSPRHPHAEEPTLHRLSDGRALAYSEYGDPDGAPVLYFHGGPGSRFDGRIFATAAREAGTRLVAPDRPGIGGSDFQPDRTLLDWPTDVTSLADALGFERFAVMGWSEGGPWALACASAMPERLTAAMTVAGGSYGAVDPEGTLDLMDVADRLGGKLALHFGPGLRMMYSALEVMVDHAPNRYLETTREHVCDADRKVLEDPVVAATLVASAQECFRQGSRGLTHDATQLYRPWPFDVRAITMRVHFVQGGADTLVPPEINRRVADATPDSVWHEYPDEGHLLAAPHGEELFGTLMDEAG